MSELVSELKEKGFKIFPIKPGLKDPAHKAWQKEALSDVSIPEGHNAGVLTTSYKEDKALVVVDLDIKQDKNGIEEYKKLKSQGYDFPPTFTVKTPSGGYHLYYFTDTPVKGGVDVLAKGIDIRSRGQYVVAPGSYIDGKKYEILKDLDVALCPEWIKEKCSDTVITRDYELIDSDINVENAYKRASNYLQTIAPKPNEGSRNHTGYIVACKLKDFGLSLDDTLELMLSEWESHPPLDADEIRAIVISSYKNGVNPVGIDAPEKQFLSVTLVDPKKAPLEEMNDRYAVVFVNEGHKYLVEEKNKGKVIRHYFLNEQGFRRLLSTEHITYDDGKKKAIFDEWVSWGGRREYYGIVMYPGKVDHKFYNTWRGYPCEDVPISSWTEDQKLAVEMFDKHLLENVSCGDTGLYKWIKTYLAHMIQKPEEKPLTALTLKGNKGTGKSLVVNVMRSIMQNYCMVLNNINQLVGDYNGHLEGIILLNLNEVYWGGNKHDEGIFKDLITEEYMTINAKFEKPKMARNFMRIILTTNAEFVNPATGDERRYTIKTVNPKPCFNREEFKHFMDIVLKKKGNESIYHWLKNQDLSEADINTIYETEDLTDQKLYNLTPTQEFVRHVLNTGRVGRYNVLKDLIPKDVFKSELYAFMTEKNPKAFKPSTQYITKYVQALCPSIKPSRNRVDGELTYTYMFPDLAACRKEFETFLNAELEWDEIDHEDNDDLI